MSRSLFVAALAVATLAGCASSQPAPSLDDAQAAVDRQIAEAGQRIQRSQAELFQAAALNVPVLPPPADIRDDGQPVTLAWQGDAAELLQSLASARGPVFRDRRREVAAAGQPLGEGRTLPRAAAAPAGADRLPGGSAPGRRPHRPRVQPPAAVKGART